MLEEVLQHLNNWFLVPDGIHTGEFTVQDGGITLPFLQEGQYFRVVGSVFNDGLYQYPAKDMSDEIFDGAVWVLAVPKAVIAFTSESFAGYSYSKATNASGMAVGWQDVFRSRLNAWRRIGGII